MGLNRRGGVPKKDFTRKSVPESDRKSFHEQKHFGFALKKLFSDQNHFGFWTVEIFFGRRHPRKMPLKSSRQTTLLDGY